MLDLLKDLNKLRPLLTRRDKWKFGILLGLMFLASLLEAIGIGAIPAFVSLIMNPSSLSENQWVGRWFQGLPNEPTTEILLWASGILFGFIVFKNIFLSFVFYVQARIVTIQELKLGSRMFRVYQSAPYEWHLQRSSSELLRNIQSDTSQIIRGVVLPFLDLIMSIIMTVVIIGVMVLTMPGTALLSLVTIGTGLFIVIRLFQKSLKNIGKTVWREQKEIIKSIQQGFGALVDARIIGCEEYLSKIHRESLARQTLAQRHQLTIQKSTQYVIETIAILGLLMVLILLVMTTESLADVLPIIVLLGVATIRLKQLATKIAGSINAMNSARAFIPTIVNDFNELEKLEKLRQKKTDLSILGEKFKTLTIENISYKYPKIELPAIKNISLKLNRGESIAFVGATGCGKSTLVSLILGLLEADSGHIKVNGKDIYQDIENWRSYLGYIPQSIYLIDDSIRANVAFGLPADEIDEERLWMALQTARLGDFIGTLQYGLGTIVGERGVRLSGGQRQRLGIARAIYQDPEVLVMDEATSALDNKTEVEVMQAIKNLKTDRTLIMIAHRLSTVVDCDRLYFLREGEVVNAGSYSEILQLSTEFRDLVTAN